MSDTTYANALDRLLQPFIAEAVRPRDIDGPLTLEDLVCASNGPDRALFFYKGDCVYDRQPQRTIILRPGSWIHLLMEKLGDDVLEAQKNAIRGAWLAAEDQGRCFAPSELREVEPIKGLPPEILEMPKGPLIHLDAQEAILPHVLLATGKYKSLEVGDFVVVETNIYNRTGSTVNAVGTVTAIDGDVIVFRVKRTGKTTKFRFREITRLISAV